MGQCHPAAIGVVFVAYDMIYVFCLPAVFLLIDFIRYLIKGQRLLVPPVSRIVETLLILGFPLLFLNIFDFGKSNDCCMDSAVFSPAHRPTMYVWIGLCTSAFLYSLFRKETAPPLVELIVNFLLLLGIVLNVLIGYQIEWALGLMGNLPIALLLLMALMENQRRLLNDLPEGGRLSVWLSARPWLRHPLPLLLGLPFFVAVTGFLMLFGQQPDAVIRAFTETYHHGFSQWNYMCDSVQCGGHYLCTVAAKGHPTLVRPLRYGRRGGGRIVCNRQLLVANAFEELIAQRSPQTHRWIRARYDRVGDWVIGNSRWLERPYIADAVYVLMKPLEWLFLAVLYCCDRKPENRIARQYLGEAQIDALRPRI